MALALAEALLRRYLKTRIFSPRSWPVTVASTFTFSRFVAAEDDIVAVAAEHDRAQVDLVALVGLQAVDDQGRALLGAVLLAAALDYRVDVSH